MKRKISFDLWLISLISAILITFSVTVFVACSPTENGNAADTQTPSSSEKGDSPYYFDSDKIQEVLEKFEKESVLGLDKDECINAIKATVPPKTVDINLGAFELGYSVK